MGTVESDIQWGQHTLNASPLNLRNMGPGRSLLLINGRRVADYPLPYQGKSNFANYNNIPTAIVERIEVLASGASAIYGSDAVAGVINVILKTDFEGDELKVRVGTSTRGGRDLNEVIWAGGKTGQQWSLTYALQYFNRDPLFASDRPYMDSVFDAPRPSLNPQDLVTGILPNAGVRLRDAGNDYRLMPPAGTCEKYEGEFFLHNRRTYDRNSGTITDTGWQCADSGPFKHWTFRNGSQDRSGYLYGTWGFDNGTQAWATVGVWDSEGTSLTFMPVVALGFSNGGGGSWFDPGIVGRSGTPGTVIDQAVHRLTPSEVGGLDAGALTRSDERAWDVSAGLRGTMFNDRFDWDFSLGRAEYRVDEAFPTVVDSLADAYFLGPRLGTTADGLPIHRLNQDRFWNPLTPEQYRSISTFGKNHAESWLTQASFSITGDLLEGWAGPIGFAAVLEVARQGYELAPDPNTLGENPLYTTQSGAVDLGSGERDRYALGLEFKVPLLESLTATLAGRFDKYNDIGIADDAKTWNAGLEWRPLDNLLLRGTYATSFRAPDMHFIYAVGGTSIRDLVDSHACITTGSDPTCEGELAEDAQDVSVVRKGTPNLDVETGRSWTYGFVWDVVDGLSLSADYWNIELDDEIDDVDVDRVLTDEAGCLTGQRTNGSPWNDHAPDSDYCRFVVQRVRRGDDPDGAGPLLGPILSVESGPINRAQRYVSGIDASLKYLLPTERHGDFSFQLNYTNLLSLETREFTSDVLKDKRDEEPRSKLRGSVSWQGEKWNATLYADRVGSVRSVRYGGCLPFADGHVPNADKNCLDDDQDSPTLGQQTALYWGRVGPAITWSTNIGYQWSERAKVNLYVSNIFDSVNEEKDPFKRDFAFIADRIFSPVGREVSVEYIYKF